MFKNMFKSLWNLLMHDLKEIIYDANTMTVINVNIQDWVNLANFIHVYHLIQRIVLPLPLYIMLMQWMVLLLLPGTQ